MKDETQIFGSAKRTRYLVGVAIHGPINGRALGRRLRIDSKEMPELYRLFGEGGAITRDSAMRLRLNEEFFAFSELAVLLHALGGQRVIVIPDSNRARTPEKPPVRLFGSANRTKVLLALHALDQSNAADICFVSGVPATTVRPIIAAMRYWELLTSCKTAGDVISGFDAEHRCAAPLRALLARLLEAFPKIEATARYIAARRAESLTSEYATTRSEAPLPIGTLAQARTLATLLQRGSMTTSMVTRATGSSRSTTRTVCKDLERYGLVVRTTIGKGRGANTWHAVNDAHPLTPALRAYATKPARETIKQPLQELPPNGLRSSKAVTTRALPGNRQRIKILIETFDAQQINVTDLARRLKRPDLRRIRAWAEELNAMRLIDYGLTSGVPTLRIAATSGEELHALVAALKRFTRGP